MYLYTCSVPTLKAQQRHGTSLRTSGASVQSSCPFSTHGDNTKSLSLARDILIRRTYFDRDRHVQRKKIRRCRETAIFKLRNSGGYQERESRDRFSLNARTEWTSPTYSDFSICETRNYGFSATRLVALHNGGPRKRIHMPA